MTIGILEFSISVINIKNAFLACSENHNLALFIKSDVNSLAINGNAAQITAVILKEANFKKIKDTNFVLVRSYGSRHLQFARPLSLMG